MSRLPLQGSEFQREQAAAWAAQERSYNVSVLLAAATRAMAHGLFRCDCKNGSCEACLLDKVIAEEEGALERGVVRVVPEGEPWPKPAA